MKQMAKKILSVLLVSVLMLSMAACAAPQASPSAAPTQPASADPAAPSAAPAESAAPADEKVTLRIYAQYSSDDEKWPYDYAVAAMKEEMPNVELELEIMAQDDNQKIKTYAATGNLPDIFTATTDIIEAFKQSNNILPLESYVDQFGIRDQVNASSEALMLNEDGHIYAVPASGAWAANMYVNKEVFANAGLEIPTNYDELLNAVKVLSSKGIIPLALFAKEKFPCVQLYDMLVTREEPMGIGKLDQGKGDMTEPAYRNAAEKLVELVNAGLISKDAFNTNADQAGELFMSGSAAMYISGSWSMGNMGNRMGDNLDIIYSTAFSNADTAEQTKWAMSGGGFNGGFAVSPYSEHKDIAAEFAVKFSLKFAEGRVVKCADPNPVQKTPPQPEAGYNAVQSKYAADSAKFESMTVFPWGLQNVTFKAAIEDNAQKLLTGQYSVDDFIADTNKSVK